MTCLSIYMNELFDVCLQFNARNLRWGPMFCNNDVYKTLIEFVIELRNMFWLLKEKRF